MADWQKCLAMARKVLNDNGVTEPFVDVMAIARKVGIEIRPTHFDADHEFISGFLDNREHPPAMYINDDEEVGRQMFTIAHELGHYFLKHPPNEWGVHRRDVRYLEAKDDSENEADYFAACLLMPEEFIEKQKKKFHLTDQDYALLAGMFGVTPSAMRKRLMLLERRRAAKG